MKYLYIILVFIFGVALGRWSAPSAEKATVEPETTAISEELPLEPKKNTKLVEDNTSPQNIVPTSTSSSVVRTENSVRDKKMNGLFDQLLEAGERNDIGEQNRILAEMEKLDSKHEKVFRAKAEFLQDDNDWEGAHKVLEDCVATIPNSAYCLRRLTNIRSSNSDDKIRYGIECLQVSKNDLLCMVDLAIALHTKGQFAKAKEYFEQALTLPSGGAGFQREYILYWYGMTLEKLNMYQNAKGAFAESCRLGNRDACVEAKK